VSLLSAVTRCRKQRVDYLGKHGNLISRQYPTPEGYPRTHRLPMTEVRVEAMSRSLFVLNFDKRPPRRRPPR